MESLTIKHIDPRLEGELRERAARHGLSVAEEARRILVGALIQPLRRVDVPPLTQAEIDARVARVLDNARRPEHPVDWKTLSDELWNDLE